MSPDYRAYLLNRGLKEDQGFILIPHDCQHLVHEMTVMSDSDPDDPELNREIYACDMHYDPALPKVCQKFHGQKRIGSAIIYIPPGCGYRKDKVE
jgi:hypothetical protein